MEVLPTCSYCNVVRIDGDWKSFEESEMYRGNYPELSYSHGVCPNCVEKHVLPEMPEGSIEELRKEFGIA